MHKSEFKTSGVCCMDKEEKQKRKKDENVK